MMKTSLVSGDEISRVLIVCPARQPLDSVFSMAADFPAKVDHAKTCQAARAGLVAEPKPDVVLTAVTLPDGNWECILRAMVDINSEGSLVVVAPNGDSGELKTELEARGVVGLFPNLAQSDARALLRGAWCQARANRLAHRLPLRGNAAVSS